MKMDISSLSLAGSESAIEYLSCIQVDGRPILPPLMSEARRQEMRQFKEAAIRREAERRHRVLCILSPTVIVRKNDEDDSILTTKCSVKVETPKFETIHNSPPRGVRFFDVEDKNDVPDLNIFPSRRRRTCAPFFEDYERSADDSKCVGSLTENSQILTRFDNQFCMGTQQEHQTTNHLTFRTEILTAASEQEKIPDRDESVHVLPIGDVREAVISVIDTPTSIETKPTNATEFEDNDDDEDNYSSTSFESATSAISTATFVLETSQSLAAFHNNSFLSEGEVIEYDEDEDDLDEAANLASESVRLDNSASFAFEFRKGGNVSTVSTCTNTTSAAPSSVFDSIHLSQLKAKMQSVSPSLFKVPGETRSPLLKGVVFMGPLCRPITAIKTPPECHDPKMKPLYDRVSACVKGYLTRRLLKTEKVVLLLQTIQGIVDLLFNLYADGSRESGSDAPCVLTGDLDLHDRLVKQLNGACQAVHDIFFKLSTAERMAIISTDRIKQAAKAQKVSANKMPSPNFSKATIDRIERRNTVLVQPPGAKRAKFQANKLPLHVPSHFISTPAKAPTRNQSGLAVGVGTANQSYAKSKSRKSVLVGPKRRRMTTPSKLSTTPPHAPSYRISGHGPANRLSQVDKVKSSSNPNVSRFRRLHHSLGGAGKPKLDLQERKLVNSTFVKSVQHPLSFVKSQKN